MRSASRNMIVGQLEPGNVTNPQVVDAFEAVPRAPFLAPQFQNAAYLDEAVEVVSGRFMLEPVLLARLIGHAEVKASDTVLVVGSMTGYTAALLAHLCRHVVALESDADLAQRAKTILAKLKVPNVELATGDLASGFAKFAPYDVIVIEGGVHTVPPAMEKQLGPDGRLVTIRQVAKRADARSGLGKIMLYTKSKEGAWMGAEMGDATAALLTGFEAKTGFVF